MKPRLTIPVLCLLSVIAVLLLPPVSAHADFWEDWEQSAKNGEKQFDELWEEFEESSDYPALTAEAEKLAGRIESLPDTIREGDRDEVEAVRLAYDCLDAQVSECSVNKRRRSERNYLLVSLGAILKRTGHEDSEARLVGAEEQLRRLPAASSPHAVSTDNGGKTADTSSSGSLPEGDARAVVAPPIPLLIAGIAWYTILVIQSVMAFGTAYRKTKAGGDNGVSLFGWLFLYSLAAVIPGLGMYLWKKSRKKKESEAVIR